MKTISSALQAHLDGELTTLATLVKITRADGAVKGLTTHDADIVWDGVTYRADGSFSPERLDNAAKLAANGYEIVGMLDDASLSDADLRAGLYDHARIDVYVCNWADLSQGVVTMRRGGLGEVTLEGGRYHAALRGLHDLLQRRVGDSFTPECRHDLGDSRCAVNLAPLTVTGSVTEAIDAANFVDTARSEADGVFAYGKLVWTSGANQGLSMEVLKWDAGTQRFSLWLPMPHAIAVGDAYTVHAGCDKRFSTCGAKFGNAVNFGGFPHLPGQDRILQYPDAR